MPWEENGKGKGPWGSSPEQPGNKRPDFDELLKDWINKLNGFFGGSKKNKQNNNRFILLGAFVVLIFWMANGIYIVDPEEQGVVLRFGKHVRNTMPGLNYHLPSPIEKVYKVPVTTINRVEVGIRSSSNLRGTSSREAKITEESLMLTGDENIVDIDFEVQWKVRNPENFLFEVRDPSDTVKSVAESAMREVIGRTPIADALTEGRSAIEFETKEIVQSILDSYNAGIEVVLLQMREVQPPTAVIDAFRDVQSARADRDRARNEAEAYRNDIIPRARGESEKIIQGAEAYKQKTVADAQGQASRFVSVYDQYRKAKDVTRKRIYLETMEEILGGMDKVIIDSRGSGTGVVPYLPLPQLNSGKKQ